MGGKKRSSKAKKKPPMASEQPPENEKAAIKSLLSTPPKNQYAVELSFETQLDNKLLLPVNYFIRHNITKFADQEWAPCIFLIKVKRINLQDFENLMKNFASIHEPFPISFSSSSLSVKSRGVKGHSLFLAPVPSKPLLNFHEGFCQMLKEKCIMDNKVSWISLCPIGLDVPDDKLVQAVKLVFRVKSPLKGYVTSLGLAEYSSKRTPLFFFDLQRSSGNS